MNLPTDYLSFVNELKKRIFQARIKAGLAVNKELVLLYWQIGKAILERQEKEKWGAKVIEQLSKDLTHSFPDMRGFSTTNLKYMRMFAASYLEDEISQQAVDQLPWGHHVALFKIQEKERRLWYIRQIIENGWSRNVLLHHIDSNLYERQGKALTNFSINLPAEQSDLAQEIFKSSYNLEFLTLERKAKERELEKGLITNIKGFLLELGTGFAFMGSQYKETIQKCGGFKLPKGLAHFLAPFLGTI